MNTPPLSGFAGRRDGTDVTDATAEAAAERLNIAGRLERLPLSSFHWKFLAILGVAMFFDGFDLTVAGFVIPPLQRLQWLTRSNTALFIGLPLLAAAIGSILAGIAGDRLGRRRLFQVTVLVYSVASLGCGLATNYPMLLAFRTLNLLALGVLTVTGYAYMNEFTPRQHRGGFQSAVSLLVNGGLPVGALLARSVIPVTGNDVGWRIMFLASVIPALLVFAGRRLLPESPRWLASRGRDAEADATLCVIEQSVERDRGGVLPPGERMQAPIKNLGWDALFRGPRGRFALAIVFNICHLIGIFVLVSWLPSILVARGLRFREHLHVHRGELCRRLVRTTARYFDRRPLRSALDAGVRGTGRGDLRLAVQIRDLAGRAHDDWLRDGQRHLLYLVGGLRNLHPRDPANRCALAWHGRCCFHRTPRVVGQPVRGRGGVDHLEESVRHHRRRWQPLRNIGTGLSASLVQRRAARRSRRWSASQG